MITITNMYSFIAIHKYNKNLKNGSLQLSMHYNIWWTINMFVLKKKKTLFYIKLQYKTTSLKLFFMIPYHEVICFHIWYMCHLQLYLEKVFAISIQNWQRDGRYGWLFTYVCIQPQAQLRDIAKSEKRCLSQTVGPHCVWPQYWQQVSHIYPPPP